jgi:hypothetical protein
MNDGALIHSRIENGFAINTKCIEATAETASASNHENQQAVDHHLHHSAGVGVVVILVNRNRWLSYDTVGTDPTIPPAS